MYMKNLCEFFEIFINNFFDKQITLNAEYVSEFLHAYFYYKVKIYYRNIMHSFKI